MTLGPSFWGNCNSILFTFLSQENQKLREQNEDLNGQLLSLSLHEAKNLFATQTKAQSLAMEIDHASRDQVREMLDHDLLIKVKKEEVNVYVWAREQYKAVLFVFVKTNMNDFEEHKRRNKAEFVEQTLFFTIS